MKSLFERLREIVFRNSKRSRKSFFDGATHKECDKNKNAGVTYKSSNTSVDEEIEK